MDHLAGAKSEAARCDEWMEVRWGRRYVSDDLVSCGWMGTDSMVIA